MAKTIKNLYNEKVWEFDFSPEPSLAFAEGFELGANAVLEVIEECLPKTSSFNPNEVIDIIVSKIREIKG